MKGQLLISSYEMSKIGLSLYSINYSLQTFQSFQIHFLVYMWIKSVLCLHKEGITRILMLTFTLRNIKNNFCQKMENLWKNGIEKLLKY